MKQESIYLQDILDRIQRIQLATKDGKQAYLESLLIQDAVIRNFEVIGEAVKRLSPELTSRYPDILWKRIAGFRDVLIHDYQRVDLDVVWLIIEQDLLQLQGAVEMILATLEENNNSDSDS